MLGKAAVVGVLTVAVTPALGVTWASACSCAEADDPVTSSFVVSRVYKGEVATSRSLGSVISGAGCGPELDGTGSFLVFASAADGRSTLAPNLCGGTRPLGTGADPALGPGYAAVRAVPVVAAAESGARDSSPALLAFGGALGLIAAAGLAFELRRRRAPGGE